MNEVVLFRTHGNTPKIKENLKHLEKSGKHVEVLFDKSGRDALPNAFNFDYEDIKNSGMKTVSTPQLYKCFHNPNSEKLLKRFPNYKVQTLWYDVGHSVILYYLQNPDYDFYWSVEYDVYFYGDWKDFFEIYTRYKTDFLGVHIMETHLDNDNDVWGLFDFNVPYERRFRCFGTINRISNRLLKTAYEELVAGNHTYYEQLFPSVATHYGMSVKDLNEIALKKTGKEVYSFRTMQYKSIPLDKMIHTFQGLNKLFHPIR